MKFEKVAFPEALQILATRAGIALQAEADDPMARTRARLLDAMRWAEAKYIGCLLEDEVAETARTYLGGRRLSGPTVRQFGLGFAPVFGDWLVRLAAADGVPPDVLVEVGLIATRALRPLPRPRDVPDPGRAGADGRVRRARAAGLPARRAGAEILQLR
jgi:DNA primase